MEQPAPAPQKRRRVWPVTAFGLASIVVVLAVLFGVQRSRYLVVKDKHARLKLEYARLESMRATKRKELRNEGPYAHYVSFVMRDVSTGITLPPPRFVRPGRTGEVMSQLQPEIEVEAIDAGRNPVIYHFEFDTVDTFDSPNLFRIPTLMPIHLADDLSSPRGLWLDLFRSQNRTDIGGERTVRMPFRASAMRLPKERHELTREELERQAVALGWGLQGMDRVREVFRYVKHVYLWTSDTFRVGPAEVFRRGVGECGHINTLCGHILELNGIRYRAVSVYSMRLKPIFPVGGHTAGEFFMGGKWQYIDPYYDIWPEGLSARDIGFHRRGPEILICSGPGEGGKLAKCFLQDLFEHRTYLDARKRSLPKRMEEMDPEELQFGLDWQLDRPSREYRYEDLFAPRIRVHVRCRYVTGDKIRLAGNREGAWFTSFHVSQWAKTWFDVDTNSLQTTGRL